MKEFEALHRIGWYRAAFDSVLRISPALYSKFVAKECNCRWAVASARWSSAKKRGYYTVFPRFCPAGQMHALYQRNSTRCPRLRPCSLRGVFSIYFDSLKPPFFVRRPSVGNEVGLIGTLSSMPELPQCRFAVLMKVLRRTHQQQACFKTAWKKTVTVCGLRGEKRCSTFYLGGS